MPTGEGSCDAGGMATTVGTQPTWDLFRDSGQPRPWSSWRTDMIMAVLSTWFVLGLFTDAYAHSTFPELESFFTPWHAVFYSGFAATGGWVLWTVWRQVEQGRRGLAAVPVGYGMTAAWAHPDLPQRPSLRTLLPVVLTLSFAASLVLLFLSYGNALVFPSRAVVETFSVLDDGGAGRLAARIVVTTIVLLAPLLLLARRWHVPAGAATIAYTTAALISATLNGFEELSTPLSIVAAGVGVDVLARWLRPTGARRGAFWAFAAATSLLTWATYLGVASAVAGRLPAVPELWTGVPIVAALLGWLLAALMLPNAMPVDERSRSHSG